ncbi:MAG: hypothetical protein BMS9Abin34_298 [Patescibacteria group bacterium]|nr:MAG: hypothetical protein BMS9Abin34_298 [Patescibacteria group bacterium]
MDKRLKIIQSFIISATAAAVFIPLITIITELNPAVKDFLKSAFTHHWIGKGVLALGIFLVGAPLVSLIRTKAETGRTSFWLKILTATAILGSLAILGFYLYEVFLSI